MLLQNEILTRLKVRDRAAIELLYKCLFPRIYGWISLNSGTREDAEDVFHDALLCIIMKLDTREITLTCDFSTFFISICRNKWLQTLYKRKMRSRISLDNNIDLYEDTNEQSEKEEQENRRYQVFMNAMQNLDPRSQAVMEASLNGKSNEEIASEMGFINSQAVADKKKNCKKRLVNILSNCREFRELAYEEYNKHRAYSK